MTGTSAALATAILWTLTAITFEYAGRRIGAMALNFLRLAVGAVFLGIYGLFAHGYFIPVDASVATWGWLGASGLVGLVLGDLFLFQAFIDIGARIAMLIYALAPAFAAILGWVVLGERLTLLAIGGMLLTLVGIALAVLGKPSPAPEAASSEPKAPAPAAAEANGTKERAKAAPRRARGILFAFFAALGQAGGLILSKIGAPTMDAFSGTQIRVVVAVLAFGIVLLARREISSTFRALRDGRAAISLVAGSFFGPFLGVSLSLAAVQGTSAGIAASIMSLVPVLIIAPSVVIFREKLRPVEAFGAVLAVAGTVVLFI